MQQVQKLKLIFVILIEHKGSCPYKTCVCELCFLTVKRQKLMAKTISVKRQLKINMKRQDYKPPPPEFDKNNNSTNKYKEGNIIW